MSALDDAMNSRLSQILQMGSNANQYAAQASAKQQAVDAQAQQLAFQKQQSAAMAQMQKQQQLALTKQASTYQSQIADLIKKVGSSVSAYSAQPAPTYSGGTGGAVPTVPKGAKGNNFASFLQAISGQESGGNYGAVNHSSGALGKYQVMPGNVANWARLVLGHPVSTSDFLHSPQLQEQIAQGMLQRYYNKYGPAGAAVAWYGGEGTAQRYVKSGGRGFDAPQGAYPSINQYALSVLHKMGLR